MSLKPGKVLNDRYRIGPVLGAGGMGTVHRATHLALDQAVAIKVMSDTNLSPNAVHRFMREAKLSAKLRCEHVVHVLDFAETPAGAPYIVLEYLEGQNLLDVVRRRGPIEVGTAVDWVLQALVALAEAHSIGIVHRDLKPGNVFLATLPDGEKVIKVMDFGLSKSILPDDEASAITHTSATMGTPGYCAPELLQSARRASPLSDIFAMGVVLYELLTAKQPFAGPSLPAVLTRIREGAPTPPRTHVEAIPRPLENAILRCLASDPADRFADAGELALAIAPFATRPAIAKRVVRMLGDDIASERLEAVMAVYDAPLEPTVDVKADAPASPLVTLPPPPPERVATSTLLMEPGPNAPVPPRQASRARSPKLGLLVALVVVTLVAGALVASPRLVRAWSSTPAATTSASPPASASAATVAEPPARSAVSAEPPPASPAFEPPPASSEPATATRRPAAPPPRRVPIEPSPATSGTSGFGGRH